MPKYLQIGNDTFMIVTPAKSLFKSSMVHDVVTSGGQFVVNMGTGLLSIYRENVKKTVAKTIRPYYKPMHKSSIRLSDDLDVALVQIKDQFAINHSLGTFYWTNKAGQRYSRWSRGDFNYLTKIVRDAYNEYIEKPSRITVDSRGSNGSSYIDFDCISNDGC